MYRAWAAIRGMRALTERPVYIRAYVGRAVSRPARWPTLPLPSARKHKTHKLRWRQTRSSWPPKKHRKNPVERRGRELQNPSHDRRCRLWPPRMARRWRDGGGLPLPLPLHAAPHPPPSAAPPRAAPTGQCCRDRWSVQLRQVPAAPHGKRNSSAYTIFPQICWALAGIHTLKAIRTVILL
jgi:hypothetical protein